MKSYTDGRLAQLVRASALQAEGRGFESLSAHHKIYVVEIVVKIVDNIKTAYNKKFSGGVAQLVRASACHAEGREFEPRHSRHKIKNPLNRGFFILWQRIDNR